MVTKAESNRKWRKKNAVHKKSYQAAYRIREKEAIHVARVQYYRDNRIYARDRAALYRRELKEELYRIFGSACVRCGFDDHRALQLDHIHGGGNRERRVLSSTQVWQRAINNPEGYQMLCANCNSIKRHEED